MISRLILALALCTPFLTAQEQKAASTKPKPADFSWVNQRATGKTPVKHGSFMSPSMKVEVGYYIYLPPGYDKGTERYPVVYHLHGGRPGGEHKSIKLSASIDKAIRSGEIEPTIYVYPNGGPMSWYNYPQKGDQALGEDVFINETIPHIDQTYRTIRKREGRAIEGFSQGGRGTTRIVFKHPQLFCSAAPGGSGYEPEKRIQENGGAESANVIFAKGYNTWDLAAKYAENPKPEVPMLLWVGTKGFNYEYNLKYSEYLKELKIGHEMIITEGAKHSALQIYEADGLKLMQFHQRNFSRTIAK